MDRVDRIEIGPHDDGRWFVRQGRVLVLYPTREDAERGAFELARLAGASLDDSGGAAA